MTGCLLGQTAAKVVAITRRIRSSTSWEGRRGSVKEQGQ